ncbi:CaiB/BaiF CoA transferase family protein [Polymorphum gilvum]|uniref:Putative fatty-acyl-CoA racemase CoA-transferase family III n=1 Tax=Polymorphum gilvum (strain LMG 25793 / CGMCC 1.9160 / SL003B-26A1) TaxID=991905 RepID=F2J2M2_POLGS|nr:CaiB/BaiF CoA-transferase family protein [Polymorphum gilvum]ADZ70936.1 Putative fatty-acyl-CoA racemase; CoA-transferase family III [Polymorphum gilvum SL003B-26A1]
MSGPLTGLRLIEMVGLGPAPFCAMMLSDMGAEVVRVHAKGARPAVPLIDTEFDVLARGRRSLAIDLKVAGAREALLDLVEKADGLVEGFRPGVMERLGLGPDVCLACNPRLVYGRMTGWGQDGPLAPTAGHDITYIALAGVLHAIGPKDRPPAVPLNLVGDFGGGGLLLAFGMVCALLETARSGQGQVIDAAMTDGAALLGAMMSGFKAGGGWSNAREANLLDGAAHFYGTYACKDGRYLAVGAIEPKFYRLFLDMLGLDPAAFEPQNDPARWPEFRQRLAAVFAQEPRDHWAALFAGSDACVAPVLDWDEAMAHPHNAARGTYVTVAGVPQPAPAPRFSRTVPDRPAPPPQPGADTLAVLADWGLDAARIAALTASGAI